MNLLVTGGAGFIGYHLLQLLREQGKFQVTVFDNLSAGSQENLPTTANINLIVGDIRFWNSLRELFAVKKFDAVIHLAAQTTVPHSLQWPQEDCEINLLGLLNLLECCREFGTKKFVFASSAAVYGDNENIPLQEDEILKPSSCYGASKMASEQYLRIYHQLYALNATVLRFANVYGERQGRNGEGGVVSIFCQKLAHGEAVTVFGDGRQTRDYVYAGDIAIALLRSLSLSGYQILNVSTQQETSLLQLLDAFRAAYGQEFPVNFAPAREGDIFRSVLANRLCRKLLQFSPLMTLDEGIKRTFAAYLTAADKGEVISETTS